MTLGNSKDNSLGNGKKEKIHLSNVWCLLKNNSTFHFGQIFMK